MNEIYYTRLHLIDVVGLDNIKYNWFSNRIYIVSGTYCNLLSFFNFPKTIKALFKQHRSTLLFVKNDLTEKSIFYSVITFVLLLILLTFGLSGL